MEILEVFSAGKSPRFSNEDAYIITDDFVAVIDGVTSKSDFSFNGKTTGELTADIVCGIVQKMPRESKPSDFIDLINSAIHQFYLDVPFPYDKETLGLQAVCAIYSDFRREIWMIGDCQVMVDGVLFLNQKKTDLILSNMRSLVISCLTSNQQTSDKSNYLDAARDTILPWILKSNVFANDKSSYYGYSLINGKDIPEELIRIIQLDERNEEVILATDGYPIVDRTLALSEEKLKALLASDPNCVTFPSTKSLQKGNLSFDDRTYIRFLIL